MPKKRKVGKMAIFGPKPWVNPFWKNVHFSTFFLLEHIKRHFPGLYCLKKKVGKMAIFGLNPWVNPFGKMSIVRVFELLVFIA